MTKESKTADNPAKKAATPAKKTIKVPEFGEKFNLRFRPGQKSVLMREAKRNGRSMNEEILQHVFGPHDSTK